MMPGLRYRLQHADPAQPHTTAGEELTDLDHDLSDLSVRHAKHSRGRGSSTVATKELPTHCMFGTDVCYHVTVRYPAHGIVYRP